MKKGNASGPQSGWKYSPWLKMGGLCIEHTVRPLLFLLLLWFVGLRVLKADGHGAGPPIAG